MINFGQLKKEAILWLKKKKNWWLSLLWEWGTENKYNLHKQAGCMELIHAINIYFEQLVEACIQAYNQG